MSARRVYEQDAFEGLDPGEYLFPLSVFSDGVESGTVTLIDLDGEEHEATVDVCVLVAREDRKLEPEVEPLIPWRFVAGFLVGMIIAVCILDIGWNARLW